MIRYFLYSLVAASLLTGCVKKTDELFEKTADERIREALNNYKTSLLGAPGWKLYVYPEGLVSEGIEVGGLTYYLTFPDSNRVVMVSDFAVDMASVPKESGFRLKAAQRPSLVFDTYGYIHVAADPDEAVSFSPTQRGGFGWGTDFDFSFTELEIRDTFVLKGNFNKSDALLIRATQEEMDAAFDGRLGEIVQETQDYSNSNPFLYFTAADNSDVSVSFNLYLNKVNFSFMSGGMLTTFASPFSHTIDGIHFRNPVTVGGYTFQDALWDDAQERYYLQVGSNRVNILNSDEAVFPFYVALGRTVTTISVPVSPLDGQSTAFANIYDQIKNNLKNGPFNLDLNVINFVFDDQSNVMSLEAFVVQDGFLFVAQYEYTYTINSSNTASFIRTGANVNGVSVEDDMGPLLDYIDNDEFTLDYYTGSVPVLGQFTSQDRPAFFFTGTIQ